MTKVAPLHGADIGQLATVSSVDTSGRILAVCLAPHQRPVSLYAQARHISAAIPGDELLVQETERGLVATALLAGDDCPPAAHLENAQGHISLQGKDRLTLVCGKATFTLFADGRLNIKAKNITAASEGEFVLSGWPIRLN